MSEQRNGVRERILEAAIDFAQTSGIEAMSQAKVALRAGVRQSHLTYYFPTRVDLIKAVLNEVRQQIVLANRREITRVSCSDGSPIERLREHLKRELANEERARMLLSLFIAAREDEQLHDWLIGFEREMLEPAIDLLDAAGLKVDKKYAELMHMFLCGCATLSVFVGGSNTTKAVEDGIDALIESIARQQS